MTETPGRPNRKLPVRADALKVPVQFEAAIKAVLETKPPPIEPKKKRSKTPHRSAG